MRFSGLSWIYAGVLEYLQHFSPDGHPSVADFVASALGEFFGGWVRPSLCVACGSPHIRRSS